MDQEIGVPRVAPGCCQLLLASLNTCLVCCRAAFIHSIDGSQTHHKPHNLMQRSCWGRGPRVLYQNKAHEWHACTMHGAAHSAICKETVSQVKLTMAHAMGRPYHGPPSSTSGQLPLQHMHRTLSMPSMIEQQGRSGNTIVGGRGADRHLRTHTPMTPGQLTSEHIGYLSH